MDGYALGISEFTTWPWTFGHGFSAIEVTEMKLDHARLDEQFESLNEANLTVASRKMRIALEPLNPSLMNVDTALWSLYDAFEIFLVQISDYRRPYVVEIFSSESLQDSLWTHNLDEVLAESARGFQHVWEHAVAR